ncbi:HNH endonuclease signature motif containing protein [Agrococcus jejuensis]|uniref:HNH nuclease domain-containing protein n=1 Tax=Agrococcus jejuensis TaxID=399736 RepID=A0A1G8GYK5_9MICO|nr:HNH endonuclease signature motif containing protein [Agrococcus jejuensis]SDH99483.1 protein of unknown function [Agrococcus jejuensis]
MRDDETVETAVTDALVAGSLSPGALPNAELIVAFDELAARRRAIDAALVRVAGEIAARSDGLAPEDSLARAAGHRSVRELVQHRVGVRSREASTLCAVADATRSRLGLSGATIPVPHRHVAAALAMGAIGIAQAHAIVEPLVASSARIAPDDLEIAELDLVAHACGADPADDGAPMVPEDLATVARRWIAHLDPDGEEPRHDDQLAQRYLRTSRRRDGMLKGEFLAMPEQGDAFEALLDAMVMPRRVVFEDSCGADESDAVERPADERTPQQRRIDALADVAAHYAATEAPKVCDEAPTLVITVAEDALHGRADRLADLATLQRSGLPVPVHVAARILCDGFVQTVVQRADGEPLRLGRRRRLFSMSQRRAIVARDRRCRAPGCTAPPAWCETHHVVRWADDGRTDVANGILLCRFHHAEVHRGALTVAAAIDAEPDEVGTTAPRLASATRRRWRVTSAYRRRSRLRGSPPRAPMRT